MAGISRGCYYRKKRPLKDGEKRLEDAVASSFQKNNGAYGRIRIQKELGLNGIEVSEWKVSRIMKSKGLVAKGVKKRRWMPAPSTGEKIKKRNLIYDKFNVTDPNRLWCSDISLIKIRSRYLYICGIIDVGTRRIVGWSIKMNMREAIAQDAIRMACGLNPGIQAGSLVFHTDGGMQFVSRSTTQLVESCGFVKSMSRPGTPQDNQPIESFWKTLKRELPEVRHMDFEEAKAAMVQYIELYYNSCRLHSSLNYETPNEYYKKFLIQTVH